MRVSLLLLRDLTWLAVLFLSIIISVLALAVTRPHGRNDAA